MQSDRFSRQNELAGRSFCILVQNEPIGKKVSGTNLHAKIGGHARAVSSIAEPSHESARIEGVLTASFLLRRFGLVVNVFPNRAYV